MTISCNRTNQEIHSTLNILLMTNMETITPIMLSMMVIKPKVNIEFYYLMAGLK